MPATLQTNANAPAAPSHAWRTLQETELRSADIWMLPEPAFNVELSRMLEGQFLADHQTIPSITPQDPAMANIASHGEP
jgi:hypothetical protein